MAIAHRISVMENLAKLAFSSIHKNVFGRSALLRFSPWIVSKLHTYAYQSPLPTQNPKGCVLYKKKIGSGQGLFLQQVRHAGHSQWQNRKHIKGAKDAQKSMVASKMMKFIRIAIKEGGDTDPKFNSQLARAIESARRQDVPLSTIEAVLKQAEKTKDSGSLVTFEARGPGNSFLILEAFTDKLSRTKQNMTSKLRKHGGELLAEGALKHIFEQKGVIEVTLDENCPPDMDAATELAIEVEAEEVDKVRGEEDKELLQFICEKKDFAMVKKNLEQHNLNIVKAKLEYIPTTTVPLGEQELQYTSSLYDHLVEFCDVVNIYDNIVEEKSS